MLPAVVPPELVVGGVALVVFVKEKVIE